MADQVLICRSARLEGASRASCSTCGARVWLTAARKAIAAEHPGCRLVCIGCVPAAGELLGSARTIDIATAAARARAPVRLEERPPPEFGA